MGIFFFFEKPSVSFCSASASAKNVHFGASLSTGIKVYSLTMNYF